METSVKGCHLVMFVDGNIVAVPEAEGHALIGGGVLGEESPEETLDREVEEEVIELDACSFALKAMRKFSIRRWANINEPDYKLYRVQITEIFGKPAYGEDSKYIESIVYFCERLTTKQAFIVRKLISWGKLILVDMNLDYASSLFKKHHVELAKICTAMQSLFNLRGVEDDISISEDS